MTHDNSRRAFFLRGGAALGAGVAGTAAASSLAPPPPAADADLQRRLGELQDREAIRELHQALLARVEQATGAGALATHLGYRGNAQQALDAVRISADGRHAVALWHVDVKVATPLQGDSTAAQMARLQGQHESVHWESGRLQERYEKRDGQWHLASLQYLA